MKKNRMMRLASILLVCVLLTTSVISGTFAKYTSSATADDTARVAKWNIQLNDKAITETFTFDLFKTINDTDSNAETDINPTDGTIIAPGTTGSFDIKLKNLSEVTAEYSIDYTVTKSDDKIPIEFSVDGGQTWTADLTDVVASNTTKLAMNATDPTTVTVQWRWVFVRGDTDDAKATNNGTDTTLGIAGTATVKVEAKITVEQVD